METIICCNCEKEILDLPFNEIQIEFKGLRYLETFFLTYIPLCKECYKKLKAIKSTKEVKESSIFKNILGHITKA